jgi:hypothetical protein
LLLVLAALGGGAGGEGGWCGERDGEEGEDWEVGEEHFEKKGWSSKLWVLVLVVRKR